MARGDTEIEDEPTERGEDSGGRSHLDRRSFMRSALAVGGTGALSSVVSLFGWPDTAAAAESDEGVTVAERHDRQHSWDDYSAQARGTAQAPEHHLLLFLDYQGDGEPSAGHRRQAAASRRPSSGVTTASCSPSRTR